MKFDFIKLKKSINKIKVISIIIFVISIICIIPISYFLSVSSSYKWGLLIPLIFLSVIAFITLFASIAGLAFLNANKNVEEVKLVRKKGLLNMGFFYFVYSSKIEEALKNI